MKSTHKLKYNITLKSYAHALVRMKMFKQFHAIPMTFFGNITRTNAYLCTLILHFIAEF